MNNNMKLVIESLFSFEAVFVLFVFSGAFKATPFIQSLIPMDATLFFLLISMVIGVYVMIKNRLVVANRSGILIYAYLLLAGYALLSMLWSPSNIYAQDKGSYMMTTVLWSLVASSLIVSSDSKRVKRFLVLMFIFAIWQSVQGFIIYQDSGREGFINVLGATYLGTGQIISFGAIITVAFIFFSPKNRINKVFALGILCFLMYVLLVLGGRGPFLATVMGMLFTLFFSVQLDRRNIKIRGFVAILIGFVLAGYGYISYLISSGQTTQTLNRLIMLINGTDLTSAGTRAGYYGLSIDFWSQSPVFGHGLGSWPIMLNGRDIRDYPHNMFLEALSEMGVVGFILLLILIGLAASNLFYLKSDILNATTMGVALLFVCATFNIMISGDIPDNRSFFCMLGLLPYISNQLKRQESRGKQFGYNQNSKSMHPEYGP